ncbi:hypothetical protein O6H91_Y530700 [Diphasiastrum complanatum]|nr:hypothetical protein O6H91_Y530700 [Diphasiastrum complanatum]
MLPGDGAGAWIGAMRCSCSCAVGFAVAARTTITTAHRKFRSRQRPCSSTLLNALHSNRNVHGTRKNSATNLQCSLESGQDNSSRVLVSDAVTGRELAAAPSTSAVERYDNGYGQVATLARTADPSSISEWEMDFCSRPILDDRGKKVWELVVCDSRRQLLFTRFYPNNVINSVTLKEGLLSIINSLGVPKPEKVRFFRSQMQTIISKACADLDIQAVPSQRVSYV